jgi:hypothetical protein
VTERPLPERAPQGAELLGALVRHGVDFVVVGGFAGYAHGSNYPTYDLDVAYARDQANIVRLVEALEEIGVRLRGAPEDVPFQLEPRTIQSGANFTFITRFGDFDVLADLAGIRSYDQLKAAAEKRTIFGLEVAVASIDHLIAMKRASNRTKDQLMVEEYIVIADEQRRAAQADEPSSS